MAKSYLGVRVEINNKFVLDTKTLKKSCSKAKIDDVIEDARITVEKKNDMLIARGKEDKLKGGMINFSLMAHVSKQEAERVVKIVNVLGNDRLIKEKVSTLCSGESVLNDIPELQNIKQAFYEIDDQLPGFINNAWYYAPEAKIK